MLKAYSKVLVCGEKEVRFILFIALKEVALIK